MDKKKQIEEMAKLACSVFDGNCMGCSFNFYPPCPPKASAERLYAAGYRKQSGWISVDERLPDENVRVLVYLTHQAYGHTHMDTDRIFDGTWVRWSGSITHWMPLPEPPKGEWR